MSEGVFIGIDHGGTNTTAIVFDPDQGKMASQSVPMPKLTPGIGLVEHDPEDFLRTSIESAERALRATRKTWRDVRGVGIANQGETSIAWSAADGQSIGPAISWEDRRTSNICDGLTKQGIDKLVRERTGVLLDPYFSASKFHWFTQNLRNIQEVIEAGQLRLGGTDSYVINRLTGGVIHATDAATGSRTALLNLRSGNWDKDLLSAFGLEAIMLPVIQPTTANYGVIDFDDIDCSGIPITADTVDAHAALFAQSCWDTTTVKATYGTGAFIEVNTGTRVIEPDGKFPVFIAWDLGDGPRYTIEGGVFSVGSAIDWAVRSRWLPSVKESSELARTVSDRGGVLFIPCFTGLSAPHWVSSARAGIFGLGIDTEDGHIARALLDGIAFQCSQVILELNEKLDNTIQTVRADGGPSTNEYLMQTQADLLGMPIEVSLEPDMTALGAGYLAAIGAGAMTVDDVASIKLDYSTYEPRIGSDQRELEWAEWRRGVNAILNLTEKRGS